MNPNSFYIQPQPGNRYFPGPGPVVISAAAGYQRPQLDTVPAEGTSDEPQTLIKPSCSYSCLIGIALLSSPTGCLPVNEIYKSIEREFPYYQLQSPEGWKNCIRHTLSVSDCFEKFERETAQPGKAKRYMYLWGVNPERKATLLREANKVLPGFENHIWSLEHHACGPSYVPDYGRVRYISSAPPPITHIRQPTSARFHTIQYHPDTAEYTPQHYAPSRIMTPAPVPYLGEKPADCGPQYYMIKSPGGPAPRSTVKTQRTAIKPRKKPAKKTSKPHTQAAKRTSEWVRTHTSSAQPELILPEESTIFELNPDCSATPSPTVHYMPHQHSHEIPDALPESLDLPDSPGNDWLSELLTPQVEETEVFKPSDIPPYYHNTGIIAGLMQPAEIIPKAQMPHTPSLSMSDTSLLCRASGSMQNTKTANTRILHQQTEPRDVTGVDLDSEFLKSVDLKTYVDNDDAVAQFENSLLHEEPDTKKEFPPNVICTSGTFSTSDRIPEDDTEISSLDLASAIAIDGILARISKDLAAFTESKNKSAVTSERDTGPSSESIDRTRYTHTCVYTSSASYAPHCNSTIPADHSTTYNHPSMPSAFRTSPAHTLHSSGSAASDRLDTLKGVSRQKVIMDNTVGRNDMSAHPCSTETERTFTYQQVSEPPQPSGAVTANLWS